MDNRTLFDAEDCKLSSIIEPKLVRKRSTPRSRILTRSSSSSSGSPLADSPQASAATKVLTPDKLRTEDVTIPSTCSTAAESKFTAPSPATKAVPFAESFSAEEPTPMVPMAALDDELLLILGDDPSLAKPYGEDIHPDLAIRLQYITRSGLPKDVRKKVTNKYLLPANCASIEAPILNPEMVAAVTDAVLKRDKGIELRQKQRTSAITCFAKALTLLLTSDPRNTVLIQILMDAIKLMCDSQNLDSTLRRNLVLNTLKEDLKNLLQATKIDTLLFSENLAETLKVAKAISKSGADMKPSSIKPRAVKTKPPQKHLNWQGPSQNHRLKGAQRTKEPVYKDRPISSSKPSSRRKHGKNNQCSL